MLNMIPINIVTRIKSVREFLSHSNSVLGNLKMLMGIILSMVKLPRTEFE